MLINEHKSISFINKSILLAQTIIEIDNLCYQYHIDVNDRKLNIDIGRLSQYAMLTRVIQTITTNEHYIIFIETGPISTLLQAPTLRYACSAYKSIARLVSHRFIKCSDCNIPKQPMKLNLLTGELKDAILLATCNPHTNLSKIKKFIRKNRLTDVEQQIGKSVHLSKILLFS